MYKIRTFIHVRYRLSTAILLILFLLSRLYTRMHTDLWFDEVEEVKTLISISYLFRYLPTIIGGGGGGIPVHQLMVLPLNFLSPGNKYILSLPGFIFGVSVFLFIPFMLRLITGKDDADNRLGIVIARLGLILDPRLTFQTVEIRPYALLPLVWMFSFYLCYRFIKYPIDTVTKLKFFLPFILGLVLVLIWHIYGIIMIITSLLYLFTLHKLDVRFRKKILYAGLFLCLAIIIALPVWWYFSRNSSNLRLDTFEFLPLPGRSFNRVSVGYLPGQAVLFLLYLAFFLVIFFRTTIFALLTKNTHRVFKMLSFPVFLAFAPVFMIFFLDFFKSYWFLYRQFAWVGLPVYLYAGYLITENEVQSRKT